MATKRILAGLAIALSVPVVAQAQSLVAPLEAAGSIVTAPFAALAGPVVEGRSVGLRPRTEPQAFYNESDEKGYRRYGNPENPELGE